MAYWDTSCVLKLYAREPDSERYIAQATTSSAPLMCSVLVQTELYYGLCRKETVGDLKAGSTKVLFDAFIKDWRQGRFVLIPIGDPIQELARKALKTCLNQTVPIFLRSLDGLHLASALATHQTELVSADLRMQHAANALGIRCPASGGSLRLTSDA
jgi:predicted nucleic acid-binding protein